MPKIVFLPARMLLPEMFSSVAALLSEYEVLYADLTKDDSIEKMADRAVSMLANDEKAVFAGISMGGYVALDIAVRYPKRVKSLVLTATNARADSSVAKEKRREEIANADAVFDELMQKMALDVVCSENDGNSELNNFIINGTRTLGKEVFKKQQKAIMFRKNRIDDLSKISVPALIVGGADDKITSRSMIDELHDNIPKSELCIIERAGHLSPLENPEKYAAAVKDFLNNKVF